MRTRFPHWALLTLTLMGCGAGELPAYPPQPPPTVSMSMWAPPPAQLSPPPPSARAQAVVAYAAAQVGHPYCWGGVGPRCFDCSGLAMMAWGRVGVPIPRTADDVAKKLPQIAMSQIQPGDILWWPGHVGIYAGDGWSIEALDAKSGVVRRRPLGVQRAYRPRV